MKSISFNCRKIQVLTVLVILVFAADTYAQDDLDETKLVGFACFYEGRPTKVVSRFEKLLKKKRYTSIRQMLHSTNSAERFMAVLCLEGLSASGQVTLTTKEDDQITHIKSSPELVAICSGCFPHPGIPLKEAFESDLLWGTKAWVKNQISD